MAQNHYGVEFIKNINIGKLFTLININKNNNKKIIKN